MKNALIARAAIAAAIVTLAGVVPAAAQTPRTPWGDPDLQGNYTNKYEQGTPFERPDEFSGRRLEDVKGEELAQIKIGRAHV